MSGHTQNHPKSLAAKVELREWLLAEVPQPRVMDVFAGEGEMYGEVWADAEYYVGCDNRVHPEPGRLAYFADSHELLRHIDLQSFTIFDVDAWSDPWYALWILARRRPIGPGEVVGLASTEARRWGRGVAKSIPRSVAALTGMPYRVRTKLTRAGRDDLTAQLWRRVLDEWGARPIATRRARGTIGSEMIYTAMLLESSRESVTP